MLTEISLGREPKVTVSDGRFHDVSRRAGACVDSVWQRPVSTETEFADHLARLNRLDKRLVLVEADCMDAAHLKKTALNCHFLWNQ